MSTDEYVVAAKWNALNIEEYVPLQNSGKFAQAIFYFLKTGRKISCKITERAKAVNNVDKEKGECLCGLISLLLSFRCVAKRKKGEGSVLVWENSPPLTKSLFHYFYVGKTVPQHNFCFQKVTQLVSQAFKQLIQRRCFTT